MPRSVRAGENRQVHGTEIRGLQRLPRRSAQRIVQGNVRILPHDGQLEKSECASMQFDHSKTKYPLLGMHAKVACINCHTNGDFKKPLAFAQCADCHTPDPHKGQFQARASKGECAECHNVEGWKPSLFGVKEHADFALSTGGKTCSGRLRQVPHAGRQRHDLQREIRRLHATAIRTRMTSNLPLLPTRIAAKTATPSRTFTVRHLRSPSTATRASR